MPVLTGSIRHSFAPSLCSAGGDGRRGLVTAISLESIARFPDAESFRAKIAAAGFERAAFTRLSGGIVAIHFRLKL